MSDERQPGALIAQHFLYNLTLVFIVLKLCEVIDWHWVWVLSPVIFPFLFGLLLLAVAHAYPGGKK